MADSYHRTSRTEHPLGSPPARVRTNGLAIASLVLGILWLYWIGSILALIFGYVALRQIRRSDGWQEGRGLAIAGVVLGWVGAGVLAILLALAIAVANVDDDETGRAPAQSTVTSVSNSTVPPATTSLPASPLGDEVLRRGPPDPAPPPADTASDAVEVTVLIEGEGEPAAVGDQLLVHYVGKVPDGTVFDSSWDSGQPFPVVLGQNTVIRGWEEGLVGARIGERRRLVLGPDMAYGSQGAGDAIPPSSPLAFEIDVVDITGAA